MARRSSSPPPSLDPPKLARPRLEVAAQLIERVNVGKEIQSRAIQTADDLGAYGADATKWTEYNFDLLKLLFTNDAVASEYRFSIPQFLVTHDDRLNFRNSQTKILRQITKLESILERLDLYAEPTKPADEPVPEAALTEIREALAEIKAQLPAMATSNALKSEIHADIVQIEVETERPSPRRRFMAMYLESLRDNLAKAAGAGTVAALVTAVGGILAKYFGVF